MRGSSSPAISASPQMARRWCGWKSASVTYTRALKGCWRAPVLRAARRSQDVSQATARSPMRWLFRARPRAPAASDVPPRAHYLRALLAELERIANHFGDIGAICNDASFPLIQAHCAVLREGSAAFRRPFLFRPPFGPRLHRAGRTVPGDLEDGGIALSAAALTATLRQQIRPDRRSL